MGSTRYQLKYVVDLTIQTDGDVPPVFMVKRAIETALRTLNQKKHKLGKVRATATPVEGSTAAVLELARCLREEMQENAQERVWQHEAEGRHDHD